MGLVSPPPVGEQSIIVSVSGCVCLRRLFAITFSELSVLSSPYFCACYGLGAFRRW